MTRRILLVSMAAVPALACAPIQPPSTRSTPAAVQRTVRATPDAAWGAVVEFFSDAQIPIATIDKASGIIVSRRLDLTAEQRQRWMDCGRANGRPLVEVAANVMRGSADFNVFLRPTGSDSTTIKVNASVAGERMNPFANNAYTPERCVSTGVFERDLFAAIEQRLAATHPGK